MTRFAPVHLPEDRALNGKVRQTFLRHLNLCPRSGYLYLLTEGETTTVKMMRGRAVHRILELATRAMIDNSEFTIPEPLVKAIADEVFADPEYPVPIEEHDYIRESVYRWAAQTAIDPAGVIACETLYTLELDGWEVRCRIDFAAVRDDGTVLVRDYKSGRGAPSFEDVARKRPDGSLMAKNFQLVLYALVLAYGNVVPGAERFDCEFVYPGIKDRDGNILTRPVSLTRTELDEYHGSLRALLKQLDHRVQTGDWPAIASDQACDTCPAEKLCPIPVELNPHRGEISTVEDCADALEVHDVTARQQRALGTEIRKFIKAQGPVRYGGDMVARIGYQSSEEIRDKAAMFEAVSNGEPFDREKWVKVKESFPLVKRAVTEEDDG